MEHLETWSVALIPRIQKKPSEILRKRLKALLKMSLIPGDIP